MWRERVLKVVLVLVVALYGWRLSLIGSLLHPAYSDTGDTMMLSPYVAFGIFLLIAVRNPSIHRSLIAFAAWSSFAHDVAMSILGLEIARPAGRISGPVDCACCHRRSPDRVGSGKAVNQRLSEPVTQAFLSKLCKSAVIATLRLLFAR